MNVFQNFDAIKSWTFLILCHSGTEFMQLKIDQNILPNIILKELEGGTRFFFLQILSQNKEILYVNFLFLSLFQP